MLGICRWEYTINETCIGHFLWESEVRVRGLWPGGGYEGRPRLSPEDVWGGEEVGGRAEGVWGMRCPHLLRELRPSRAVLQGWGEGSSGGGRRGGGLLLLLEGGSGQWGWGGGEGVGLLGANGVGRGRGGGGEGVGRRVSCQFCGRELTVRNMAKHLRQSCRVWDPGGGGPTAASGEWPEKKKRVGVWNMLEDEVARIRREIKE